AGVYHLVSEPNTARDFLGRAEGILGDDREPIDVRSVERRHINWRHDVGREHAPERCIEIDSLDAARGEIDGSAEAALCLVAIEDLEELLLITHRARPRPRIRRRSLRCLAQRSRTRRRALWTRAPPRLRQTAARRALLPRPQSRSRFSRARSRGVRSAS